MKDKFLPPPIFSAIVIIVFLFLYNSSNAQSDNANKEALAKIDTSVFKGKGFLNKAQFIKSLIDPLRLKEKNKDGIPILTLTSRHFELLTTIMANADLNDKPKPKAIANIQNLSRDQITSSNVIPIGIINADALILTEAQVNDNIKAKSQNIKADGKNYENVELITAGLLQGEIFQGNVSFRISPDLIQSNINNKIDHLEIDFQDGKGYKTFEMKEQLIPYQFKTIGEVSIAIKLVTKRATYLTYNILKVTQLERPIPYSDKNVVTATKVIQESIKNGRITDNVVGGEYAIYTGCDNVFDKPIIIAEGFDVGQDVNIDVMVAKYYPYLYAFRNNGYDLVFVNYSDGRDYMQNNAEVLKRVIIDVNNRKVGNNKLVVVGESMSGLIARWALRSMENAGQIHNVSHFISFDTPHQGANVPPGLVELGRYFFQHTGGFSPLVYILVPEVQAIYSPAAKQLLIHQSSTLEKDPLFDSFRQDLNNLGNGGYPNQAGIRNIALINGSLANTPNTNFNNGVLNPGDKILDVDVVAILCNSFIDVWSNLVGQNTKVYDGDAIGICGISFISKSVNFNRNLDRTPGGFIANGLGNSFPIYSTTNPKFSFVPTFSSIDYRGSLSNDNDYTFSINNNIIDINTFQTTNTGLTPFKAIYGNNFNTSHSQSSNLVQGWNELAVREGFGITNANSVLSSCVPNLPLPPNLQRIVLSTPQCTVSHPREGGRCTFDIGYVSFPSTACGGSDPIPIYVSSVSAGYIPNTIQQFIRITGNGITRVYDGGRRSLNLDLPIGTYTVSSVVKYYNPDLNSRQFPSNDEKSISTTLNIVGNCRIATCPGNEGELAIWLTDTDEGCLSYQTTSGQWFAITQDGIFVSRSRLIANGMPSSSANCFAETDPRTSGGTGCDNGTSPFSVLSANYSNQRVYFQFNANNLNSTNWTVKQGNITITNGTIDPVTSNSLDVYTGTLGAGTYDFVLSGVSCSGSASKSFTVSGSDGSSLSLNQSSWSLSSATSSQIVNVTSNVGWSVSSSDGSWLTASTTSGSNNGSFTISATTNGATSSRTGTITVSGSGVSSQTVSVSQAGTGGGGSICSNISTTNCGNASEGYTHTIDVPTAGDYKFKITYASGESNPTGSIIVDSDAAIQFSVGSSTGSWTPSSEVFVGTVQKTLSAGNHNIRIAGVNGVSGSNFAYNKFCIVSATGGGNTLSLSQGSWSPSSSSASQSINVASNISWSVSTDNPIWLTVSTSSGSGNGSFSINVTANGSTSSRSGTITVSGSGVASQIVSVTQAGTGGGGTTVCSNIGTVSCGNASEGHTHSLNIAQAGNYKFKITYASGESNATGTITVDSDPATQFSVGPSTGSWTPSVEVLVGSVQKTLSVGNHTIRIAGVNGVSGSSFTHNKLCAVDASSNRIATAFEEVEESLTVYPNPTNSKIQVSFTLQKDENVWFNLYDTQGKNLQLSDYKGKAGLNVVEFDLQNYPSGAYFIDLQYNQKRGVQKVIKVN